MLRGNGGQDIFHNEKDGQVFRSIIADGLDRFGHKIHAFCFMPNHVHMVIEVDALPLSKIMQNLAFRYTRYINKKLDTDGHLFQGRYKALLIDGDSYLLTVVRYIHNNPVDAGLAKAATDWLWSSDRSYRNKVAGTIVHTDKLMSMLSSSTGGRTKAYAHFMASDAKVTWPPDGIKGEIIGDKKFIAKMAAGHSADKQYVHLSAKALYDLAESQLGMTKKDLISPSRTGGLPKKRAIFAKAVHETCDYSMAEIAKTLKRDGSSLGRLVCKLDDSDPDVKAFKAAILN